MSWFAARRDLLRNIRRTFSTDRCLQPKQMASDDQQYRHVPAAASSTPASARDWWCVMRLAAWIVCVWLTVPSCSSARADELTRRPFLGLAVSPVPAEVRRQPGVPASGGLLIVRVFAGSSAQTAGVQAGDVLLRLGDTPLAQPDQLAPSVKAYHVGDRLRLEVVRQGMVVVKEGTLTALPYESSPDFDEGAGRHHEALRWGRARQRESATDDRDSAPRPEAVSRDHVGSRNRLFVDRRSSRR